MADPKNLDIDKRGSDCDQKCLAMGMLVNKLALAFLATQKFCCE